MALLPAGFEALENWVSEWAHPTQNRRWDKRLRSTKEEITAFYQAMLPYMERALEHCDRYPLGQLPDAAGRLFDLTLMVTEIAPNVELYKGQPGVPYSFDERRFVAAHGDQIR
jgi:hypothetical protein